MTDEEEERRRRRRRRSRESASKNKNPTQRCGEKTRRMDDMQPALHLPLEGLSAAPGTQCKIQHAAATNFTLEQTKMCVLDWQSLIIDGWLHATGLHAVQRLERQEN